MIGTLINCMTIILGGTIGVLIKRGIPRRIGEVVMDGISLCILYIGVKGCLEGTSAIVIIISMALGAIIGEFMDLDHQLNRLGIAVERKLKDSNNQNSVASGFITATLLFCVGAMAIVGSLQGGLLGNYDTLFTKSVIDGISAIILASTLGVGVILSAGCVLIYQGSITLLAQLISPFLGDVVISQMTCIGSLLIIALALNMLKLTNIKVMNYIPAMFLPIIIYLFI